MPLDWWDDPQHRDTVSYVMAGMLAASAAAAANVLKTWPRNSWVRGLGTWLSSMVAGLLVMAIGWEPLMQNHPWSLVALIISAAWLGQRVLDKIAYKVLGIQPNGDASNDPRP